MGRDRKGSCGAPSILQPRDHQPIGAHQPRLDGAQDAQSRMGGAAGPERLAGHQPIEQVAEPPRGDRRQVGALIDQAAQQPRHRLAARPGPQLGRAAVLGQPLHGLGSSPRGLGHGLHVGLPGQGTNDGFHALGERQRVGRLCQTGFQDLPTARPWPPQGGAFQVLAGAQPAERVLDQAEQGHWIEVIHRGAGDQAGQRAAGRTGQTLTGRGVRDYAPTSQLHRHTARQPLVRRHQGGGPLRRFQGLAQQQGCGCRGLVFRLCGDQGQALERLGDRIDAGRLALAAQGFDHLQPVGGLVGRAQGFVDHPLAPAASGLRRGGGRPHGHLTLGDPGVVEEPLQRALRMLHLDLGPGFVGQVLVEAREHHAAARRAGHGDQQIAGRWRRTGRSGRDDHPLRRGVGPVFGQAAQQPHAALAHIDDAQFGEPPRPSLQRALQEDARHLPVLGQLSLNQALQAVAKLDLLDLQAVHEAAERVGHFQGRGGGRFTSFKQTPVPGHQTGELKAAAQGLDGGGQVERQVARLERRLTLVEVPQRPHLRRQDGAASRCRDKGVGERAGPAARGGQHDGLGQGLGSQRGQGVVQAPG
jgi:hypothetical protein